MMIRFFLPMKTIPTVTSQEKGIDFNRRKVYTKTELLEVEQKFKSLLAPHRPKEPIRGPVQLSVVWCFPATKTHPAGSWKTSKPDTDNAIKLLKDCMTDLKFWIDDAQVACENLMKRYDEISGIYIEISELEG